MNWQRIRHIIKKEFIQIRRDPRMLRLLVAAPIFQLLIFGYAINTDVMHLSAVVMDYDRTSSSRDLLARFENSQYFDINYYIDRSQDMAKYLDHGSAQVGIEIPKGFTADLASGKPAPLQLIVDGTDTTTAGLVLGYSVGIIRRYSEDILNDRKQSVQIKLTQVPSIGERTRVWYNPDLKSVNFMVPGVLCMILLIITMLMTALAIVKEREVGTLEQLIVTPIKPAELMAGKVIPFAIIGFVDVLLIMLVARFWFNVPVAGSVFLLLLLTVVFLMTSLGLGLFVSTISRNQQQAMMTSFFIMLPSIILSGFMFPIVNMPRTIQVITYFLPLRYYLSIVRGIFLKSSGLAVLWPNVVALMIFGVVILTLSAKRFHKKLA